MKNVPNMCKTQSTLIATESWFKANYNFLKIDEYIMFCQTKVPILTDPMDEHV